MSEKKLVSPDIFGSFEPTKKKIALVRSLKALCLYLIIVKRAFLR